MIIRAPVLLAGDGEVVSQGAVRVREGRIVAVGSMEVLGLEEGESVVELDGQVLSPGLINAHCHLDYTDMGGLLPTHHFTQWIQAINALKRGFTPQDYAKAITRGYQLLLDSGTTTVANIAAVPEAFLLLAPPPLRVWWFLELIDLRTRAHSPESLAGMAFFLHEASDWLGGKGISPHAPYTASIELYRLAAEWSRSTGGLFTTHIAESREEHEMFLYEAGAMHQFLRQLGRDCSDCGHGSSFSHLYEHRVLPRGTLAVHMNYLSEYDYDLVAESGVVVVHCPKCHAFFHHSPFPLDRLRRRGVPICLGTDSLASNNSLDLRAESRHARRAFPHLTPRELWRMITIEPARALGQAGALGTIAPGAWADLVAFPLKFPEDPFLSVIESRGKPNFLMIHGNRYR